MFKKDSITFILILLLVVLAFWLNPVSISTSVRLIWLLLATFLSDFVLLVIKKKKYHLRKSKLLIPLSIFLLTPVESSLYLHLSAVVFSFFSLHLIRKNDSRIFNPVAFGLFFASLFGLRVTWWGVNGGLYFTLFLFLIGLFITIYFFYKKKRLIFSFVATLFIVSFVLTQQLGYAFAQIFTGGIWFFVIYFLNAESNYIDKEHEVFFGILTAFISLVLPYIGFSKDPLMTALIIGNAASLANKKTS